MANCLKFSFVFNIWVSTGDKLAHCGGLSAAEGSFIWASMASMMARSRGTSVSAEARLPDEGTWMSAALLSP